MYIKVWCVMIGTVVAELRFTLIIAVHLFGNDLRVLNLYIYKCAICFCFVTHYFCKINIFIIYLFCCNNIFKTTVHIWFV